MNEDKYYVRSRGRISGPFELEVLRKMYRQGTLLAVHELSVDQITWRPIREHISMLSPTVPKPVVKPPAPSSVGPIDSNQSREPGTIEFQCPQCNARIKAPAQYAGRTGQCRACKAIVPVPSQQDSGPREEPLDFKQDKPSGFKKCPACAELIKTEAKKCRHCGERLEDGVADKDDSYAFADQEDRRLTTKPASDLVPYVRSNDRSISGGRGASRVCPNCSSFSPSTAAICTVCGFDFRTGHHVSEPGTVYPDGAPFHATQHNVHIHGDGGGIGHQQMFFQASMRSVGVAYLFWFFLGIFGAHRFYAGRTESAVTMLIINIGQLVLSCAGMGMIGSGNKDAAEVGGFLGILPCFLGPAIFIWWLVDAFLIPGMIQKYNQQLALQLSQSGGRDHQ